MKNLLICWALLSLFCCGSVQADIRFERFLPVNPTSDQPVQVELWFSGFLGVWCDLAVIDFVTFRPVVDSIDVVGNSIQLKIPVRRNPTSSGSDCTGSGGDNPRTWVYSLNRLPAGVYALEIIGRDVYSPERPNFPIATMPLVVSGTSLVEVPTLAGWNFALLVLGILAFGMLGTRLER